jgi:hypothetical protein
MKPETRHDLWHIFDIGVAGCVLLPTAESVPDNQIVIHARPMPSFGPWSYHVQYCCPVADRKLPESTIFMIGNNDNHESRESTKCVLRV